MENKLGLDKVGWYYLFQTELLIGMDKQGIFKKVESEEDEQYFDYCILFKDKIVREEIANSFIPRR
jgi:hypothetical protein